MNDLNLLAVCGLYCGACYHYRASFTEGGHLLREAARRGRPLKGYTCRGCRSDALYVHPGCAQCQIRACAEKKNVLHCSLCDAFPCDRLKAFQGDGRVHHRPVIDQLADLKCKGPAQWLAEQAARWTCTCGAPFSWYETACQNCGAPLNSYGPDNVVGVGLRAHPQGESTSMELKYTVNPYIPIARQRHLVYALLEIDPGQAQMTAPAPLNLGLVVDASRSMSIPILSDAQFEELKRKGMARQATVDGVRVWQFEVPKGFQIEAPSNMDFTKEALRVVADCLRDDDRFSLVAFAEDALLMLGNTPGSQRKKLYQAIERLDRIDLGDETFMARGMEMGYRQTGPYISSERVNRMVVLTDGYTQDERDCYSWTRHAKKEGIVVSTMGLGLDFNEALLISLADVSGGHAYFVEDPQEIPNVFRQELASAQSITWRDLSLALTLPGDVTLRRAHRVQPAISELTTEAKDPVATLALGDLEAGSPPAVLLELIVPPRPVGTYRLARVTLNGRPAGSSDCQALAYQDVVVHYTEKPSLARQTDAHLMSAIHRVSALKLQNQAMEEAQRGNVAGATKRLRMAGERLIEMGQEDLGQTMLVEAELIEKEGRMSAQGTKRLRYGTRRLK